MEKQTGFFDIDDTDSSPDTNGSIGFLSINVPEELIIAAGKTPFRVCGSEKPAKLANAYLPKTFDPYVLDSLEGALDGTYSFLDGVIIANISDGHRRLYDAWRTGAPSTKVFFLDIPKSSNQIGLKAFTLFLSHLKRDLEKAFEEEITDEKLRDAIQNCNTTRTLLTKLSEKRKYNSIPFTGKEFFEMVKWCLSHDKHRVNSALKRYLQKCERIDSNCSQTERDVPRIMIMGSFMGSSSFIGLIESLGARVVCEDLCMGMQYFSTEVSGNFDNPIASLAQRYLTIPTARMVDTEARWNYLLNMTEEYSVDGIVYFALKFDDTHLFEYPYIKNKFQKEGYPLLFIEAENFVTNLGQIETRIQAFTEMLL
ncbi:benzoyl-CoA reductase/2-hydroxyglutaryl-CoA dehydratase subunit, BcrC/BadD/HgdB [Candidatus Scalindua japonica]|uniref:Benzoyl-CoA reductase/2-hydroxyglutaryl-CoA dehydratase subunit, BcrC/BadD/HgdB n=1 Tax=Candidatus Scalindua japonica TaxID=1284222 RepID=A0A286TYL4_9BACT|nr:2-hydroxyacyl-CoA dehydratase family protein [Candidatus Scalindua japonica]GAX60948.1 benzoyl-CoA reductase/2-hydroxyglutaryl-CoA dehydratase subunit, BcrC/BadD/HgdB [Candidatus Scalindua japonica]